MDNNDSIKSQQTGGLKLMTVFIAVLALHVVVIGGFTVYHLMNGGSDADITTMDKPHKTDVAIAPDGSMSIPADKTTPGTTASATASTAAPDGAAPSAPADQVTTTESGSVPAATTATSSTTPAPAATSTPAAPPASTPAPATAPSLPPAAVPATSVASASGSAPAPSPAPAPSTASGAPVVIAPQLTLNAAGQPLAPPPDASTPGSAAPNAPLAAMPPLTAVPSAAPLAGPVHMPPAEKSPDAPRFAHEHHEIYIVKITDSYRKIAHAHHLTVAELKEANHIKGNTLHTGQKLIIPMGGTYVAANTSSTDLAPTRTVMKTDSTETASLAAEPAPAATSSHHHVYTIEKGDTLVKIARKFKTTALAIMEINDIPDPAKLTIGKKLRIPSHGSSEVRTARRASPVAPPVTMQPSAVQAAPVQTTSVPAQQPDPAQVQAKENEAVASGALANFQP